MKVNKKYVIFEIFILLISFFYALFPPNEALTVLIYSAYSFLRLFAAYLLSLVFAIAYGFFAAKSKRNERIMIPILDILQSVPILGFFPVVMIVLIVTLPTAIGVELAVIFLIFTSQAWNMAFGVYEGIITIPKDILDMSKSYNMRGSVLFRTLYFPAMIPKLVYNSIMSWAGGWYFLFAAEIISMGNITYRVPGLGSYMWTEVSTGNWWAGILALSMLIIIIVIMDMVIWRPLTAATEKYRYEEYGVSENLVKSHFLKFLSIFPKSAVLTGKLKNMFRFITTKKFRFERTLNIAKWLGVILLFFITALIIFGIIVNFAEIEKDFAGIGLDKLVVVPFAILFSSLRMIIAYALSLLWIIPVAIYLTNHKKADRYLTPLFEIIASIPATALFPFLVLIFLKLPEGLNIVSILLIMTGMQWYIFFNMLGGLKGFSTDLQMVSKSYRFNRWMHLKKALLPSAYPSLITGSITGWGGGWNALIVSEYITINGTVYSVLGLGYLIDKATYQQSNILLNLIYLFFMIVTVLLFNRLLWKRLYKKAEKYKIE